MVQDQLVDYISSQMKIGVTRDAVKASLIGAGWQAADVEDTLKKVESMRTPGTGMGSTAPISSLSSKPASSAFPATGMSSKANDSQMIRVSDLISAPDSAASVSASSIKPASSSASFYSAPAKAPAKVNAAPSSTATSFTSSAMPMTVKSSGGGMIWKIATIAAIVIFGGLAGFFYMQNSSLSGKVASLSTASTDVSSKIASLNTQVDALNASNTALTASMATLSSQSSELSLELSFYAIPPGGATTAIGPVTITGTVTGGGKTPYLITTSYGTRVYVQNSKDAKVITALTPNLAASIQVSGTYVQGSQNISVTAVNGTPL